ncbi:hypothetical protein RHMOL_Rhmol09G0275600 [Rhododendron molle]|uniref:Uncharacterized protein n=1 Tax=Rhododendron molle TaxID=49168 RepID=A0ACC0MJ50_RHOML|nr:hypothetical protein RHMOL_Rhmol09G0275600 [Rhododendron molle]
MASSLVGEVIKYVSSIPMCQAVYLHVISHNNPAFHLYQKMSFECFRRLHGFYLINGQHYDSFLFVFYLNGGQSPCSPLIADDIKAVPQVPNLISCSFCRELVTLIVTYLKNGLKLVAVREDL